MSRNKGDEMLREMESTSSIFWAVVRSRAMFRVLRLMSMSGVDRTLRTSISNSCIISGCLTFNSCDKGRLYSLASFRCRQTMAVNLFPNAHFRILLSYAGFPVDCADSCLRR